VGQWLLEHELSLEEEELEDELEHELSLRFLIFLRCTVLTGALR